MADLNALLARLVERYTPPVVPPCRVCGAALEVSSCGGGKPTQYRCSSQQAGTGKPIDWGHYESSGWEDRRQGGDSDVLALIDVIRRAAPAPDDVEWVVNDMGELGVRVFGQCYFHYKGESLIYAGGKHSDGTPIMHRNVGKVEFGETVWPIRWLRMGRREHRYTVPLIYIPGISFGTADDPRFLWRPMPGGEVA